MNTIDTMNTIEQKLKRYKKLLDSNEYVTSRYRMIFENEYETLLRIYLDKPVKKLESIKQTNTESTYQTRCRRLERQISLKKVESASRVEAEYEFPMSDDSKDHEPSPAERA